MVGVDVLTPDRGRVAARPLGDGRWSATLDDLSEGALPLAVVVHRSGAPDVSGRFRWVVGADPSRGRDAVVSTAPVGGVLRAAAALLGIALVVVAVLLLLRRRRRRPGGVPSARHQRGLGVTVTVALVLAFAGSTSPAGRSSAAGPSRRAPESGPVLGVLR